MIDSPTPIRTSTASVPVITPGSPGFFVSFQMHNTAYFHVYGPYYMRMGHIIV